MFVSTSFQDLLSTLFCSGCFSSSHSWLKHPVEDIPAQLGSMRSFKSGQIWTRHCLIILGICLCRMLGIGTSTGILGSRSPLAFTCGTHLKSSSFHTRITSRALPPLTAEEKQLIIEWEAHEEVLDEVAEARRLNEAGFPISPEDLITRAKLYLAKNQYNVVDPDMLADNFTFSGPVVGPLGKAAFIKVLGGLDLTTVFPDNKARWHDWRVDPYDASRVLFTARPTGTNLGTLGAWIPEPTGKTYEGPPEAASLKFSRDGKIVEYTAAYVMDKNQGNTDGMTGVLGPLYAIGKGLPIPEGQPWQPSPLWWLLKQLDMA